MMNWTTRIAAVLVAVGVLSTSPSLVLAGNPPPATAPTAEAVELIGQVKAAYATLKSAKFAGKMSADIDVAGRTQNRDTEFVSEYQSPALFRHIVKGELIAGSTGKTAYVLELKRNAYVTEDAPAGKMTPRQLPAVVGDLLEVQNPALLLAMSPNSVSDLIEGATRIRREADTQIAGVASPTLAYTAADGRNIAMAFDPQSHLLRQATYDIASLMRSRGAEKVNKALVTIAYPTVEVDPTFAADYFAWTAPPNARQLASDNGGEDGGTVALQGKPAPDFTVKGLDGKEVTLASLKGSVVLLDFWATWCPPCVRSLPEVAEIARARKDVKVYAMNVGESAQKIKTFLEAKKIDVPVLQDADEAVSGKYAIRGIPTSVIIKPDGTIAKVFVGIPPGGKAELERELDAAGK